MTTWRDRLLELMDKSEYSTIKDLTVAAGISQGSFNAAMKEGGHTPKKSTMDKVAAALGTTSQYILYGEQRVPGQMVPVLFKNEINAWVTGDKVSGIARKMVAPPFPMEELAFAWRNNSDDMSPAFPLGTLVFFSTEVNLRDLPEKAYVLTGRLANIDSAIEERIYEDIQFSRVVMTMHGLRLVSECPEISESLPVQDRIFIGIAKYSVWQY